MAEPGLVAEGVRAMRDACCLPVTVKHRIGIDRGEDYAFVRDFVGTVAERGGCSVFIVHARNAWLQGLSPKENREVPPLRYEVVSALKADFPRLIFIVNGGITEAAQIESHLQTADGVMVGRHAYHAPWSMADWDTRFLGAERPTAGSREAVEALMVGYMERQALQGVPWSRIARHMLGLWNGTPGARRWRQVWSDHHHKELAPAAAAALARAARLRDAERQGAAAAA
jgi:tRNA-dihydrouridine synthase A